MITSQFCPMTKGEMEQEIKWLRGAHALQDDKLGRIAACIAWRAAQQGHDACHYYPEVFKQIADILGIEVKLAEPTISREEMREGCRKFEDEVYGKVG